MARTVHVNLFLNDWTGTFMATMDMDGRWIRKLAEVRNLFSAPAASTEKEAESAKPPEPPPILILHVFADVQMEGYMPKIGVTSTRDFDAIRLILKNKGREVTMGMESILREGPKYKINTDFLKVVSTFAPECRMFETEGADHEGSLLLGPYSTLTTGLRHRKPEIVKLAMLLKPGWLRNDAIEPRALWSAFVSCQTIADIVKFILEANPSVLNDHMLLAPFLCVPDFIPTVLTYQPQRTFQSLDDVTWCELEEHMRVRELSECLVPKITHNQHVENVGKEWRLKANLHGLKLPVSWGNVENLLTQNMHLDILLVPKVDEACGMSIAVANVSVVIENLCSSSTKYLGYFLSHMSVSIRPLVEDDEVKSMKLGMGSPNDKYDIISRATKGANGVVSITTLTHGGTVGANAARLSGLKLTTTDWKHQHLRGKFNTGIYSWFLRGMGGVPFDFMNPRYPERYIMKVIKNKPHIAQLGLPFNEDGSVTFTDHDYPHPISWRLSPALEKTEVGWSIFADVYLTILWRCRPSEGRTLKFTFGGYLKHLHSKTNSEPFKVTVV